MVVNAMPCNCKVCQARNFFQYESMNPSQLHIFFVQIGLMLAVAWLFSYLMRRMGQPPVLGELIGGILLGPTLLGTFAPALYNGLFLQDKAVTTGIDALLKIGMLFFMFAAGLEVNLVHFRQCRRVIALTSIMGGALPFALGFGTVFLLPSLWGQHPWPLLLALFMGTALSISALPIIARILMDIQLIDTPIGMTIMTSAMVNDLIGWTLFALILGMLETGTTDAHPLALFGQVLALVALILGLGRWVLQPLLHKTQFFKDWPGGLLTFLSVLVIVAGTVADSAGINPIFGAFLVGVALGQDDDPGQEKRIHGMIQPFALNFFAPLYFVSVGLKANFYGQFDARLALPLFLIACLGKILGAGFGARLGGMSWRDAATVGVGLNARGAIEIILASVALEHQLIDQHIFVALVAMAFATTLISSPLLHHLAISRPEQNRH